ncbi:unnamed protein product, partial [Didymodactylos carnosus]
GNDENYEHAYQTAQQTIGVPKYIKTKNYENSRYRARTNQKTPGYDRRSKSKQNKVTKRCNSNFERLWTEQHKSDSTISTNNFVVLELLGKGGFGVVYLTKWYPTVRYSDGVINKKASNGQLAALKISSKTLLIKKEVQSFIIREKKILSCCHHPFITNLITSFKDNFNVYMVFSFIAGGDLFTYLRVVEKLEEIHAQFYIAQILLAFEYLHCCKIVYRDLKPENIMIQSNGYICIIDFVWALGILTYELICGQPPFSSDNISDNNVLFEAILHHPVQFKHDLFSPGTIKFIKSLLKRNPKQRLGCGGHGIDDVKFHSWLIEQDFNEIYNQRVKPHYIPVTKNYKKSSKRLIELPPTVLNEVNEKDFEQF